MALQVKVISNRLLLVFLISSSTVHILNKLLLLFSFQPIVGFGANTLPSSNMPDSLAPILYVKVYPFITKQFSNDSLLDRGGHHWVLAHPYQTTAAHSLKHF